MGTIGYDSSVEPGMSGSARTTSDPHFIMSVDGTYTPGSNEILTEVGFHNATVDAATFEVGVYRIDTGTWDLVASANVVGTISTRCTAAVSGSLVGGGTYAVAWRCVEAGNVFLTTTGVTNSGTRNTGLTGTSALASTFTVTGGNLTSRWAVFATTTAAPTSAVPVFQHHYRMMA